MKYTAIILPLILMFGSSSVAMTMDPPAPAFQSDPPPLSPFGFSMGVAIEEVDPNARLVDEEHHQYSVLPPIPVEGFDIFIVQATPKTGVCWVMGTTEPIPASTPYGEEPIIAFSIMTKALISNYGPPTDVVIHEVEDGNLLDPSDFMLSLYTEQRIMLVMWEAKKGATLPPNFSRIALHILAPDTPKAARIGVEVAFTNERMCDLEVLDRHSQLN
jgi:hypothetical protein